MQPYIYRIILFFITLSASLFAKDPVIKVTRSIKTISSPVRSYGDTLDVTLSFFTEGDYDTTITIDTTFHTKREPVEVCLALDLSGSMIVKKDANNMTRLQRVKEASINFITKLSPEDRVAVFGWSSTHDMFAISDTSRSSRYHQTWFPLSNDFNAASRFINNLSSSTRFKYTPLYISSIVGLHYLLKNGKGKNRVLILLTDGKNTAVDYYSNRLNYIRTQHLNEGISLFTIGFREGEPKILSQMADVGGGRFYMAVNPGSLDSVYDAIADEIEFSTVDTSITRKPVLVQTEVKRQPLDVLLAFDLSGSMKEKDDTDRWRITWAQISALTFLDSLHKGDRAGILGWTANGDSCVPADTANPARFRRTLLDFTDDIAAVKAFIRDSLSLDGRNLQIDRYEGDELVRQKPIPGGVFDDTPLNVAAIVALKYLASFSVNPNKALIILTDGEKDDKLGLGFTQNFIDSMYTKYGISLYTVGFTGGDTAALQAMAGSGRGVFYYADNPDQLSEAYASLSKILYRNFAARGLMLQEALEHGQAFIAGSQKVLPSSTVHVPRFETFTTNGGQIILQWFPDHVPVFGKVDLSYKVFDPRYDRQGSGDDSAHHQNNEYSFIEYLDINDSSVILPAYAPTFTGDTIKRETKLEQGFYHVKDFFNNGNIKSERVFKNNKIVLVKNWYETGNRKSVANYSEGRENGAQRDWYDNGILRYNGYYVNGRAVNSIWFNINGSLKLIVIYDEEGKEIIRKINKE